jgi:hypothetical protein
VLILDEPTNHLDLESITALNDGLIAFSRLSCLPRMIRNLSPPLPTGLSKSLKGAPVNVIWILKMIRTGKDILRRQDELRLRHTDLSFSPGFSIRSFNARGIRKAPLFFCV